MGSNHPVVLGDHQDLFLMIGRTFLPQPALDLPPVPQDVHDRVLHHLLHIVELPPGYFYFPVIVIFLQRHIRVIRKKLFRALDHTEQGFAVLFRIVQQFPFCVRKCFSPGSPDLYFVAQAGPHHVGQYRLDRPAVGVLGVRIAGLLQRFRTQRTDHIDQVPHGFFVFIEQCADGTVVSVGHWMTIKIFNKIQIVLSIEKSYKIFKFTL